MAGETLSAFAPIDRDIGLYRGQGPGVPVRALPRQRPGAWTGNEKHRRSHGNRSRLRHRFCQGIAWRGDGAAARRDGVRLGQGRDKEQYRPGGREIARAGLCDHRHRRHRGPSAGARAGRSVRSTRSRKGGRTSSTGCSMATSIWSSTPPRAGSRSRTAIRSARPRWRARCPISQQRRRAWPRRVRSRRCAAMRLKSPRSSPIIPRLRTLSPHNLRPVGALRQGALRAGFRERDSDEWRVPTRCRCWPRATASSTTN